MNINTLFITFESEYDSILSEDKTIEEKDACVRHGIEILQQLKSSDLYSTNEVMEEMDTSVIPLLSMEYFIGKLMLQYGTLKHRMNRLAIAKTNFTSFLSSAVNLNILDVDEIRHIETLLASLDDSESENREGREEDFHGNSNSNAIIPKNTSNQIKLTSCLSPEQARARKISDFKKKKELKTRLDYLTRKVKGHNSNGNDAKKGGSSGGKITTSMLMRDKESEADSYGVIANNGENEEEALSDEIERDEDLRMLYIVTLQLNIKDTLEELNLCCQEMDMLHHMDSLRSQEGGGKFSDEQDSSLTIEEEELLRNHAQPGIWDDIERRGNILLLPGKPSKPLRPEDSHGIEVTRTDKDINGEIIFKRETVKANVFVPSMESWSMTIEEFGELELQRAKERDAEQAATIEANKGDDTQNLSRRMSQLEADGDEDNERLVDAAAYNDREWDDWKEANKKGSGNKMGKRF